MTVGDDCRALLALSFKKSNIALAVSDFDANAVADAACHRRFKCAAFIALQCSNSRFSACDNVLTHIGDCLALILALCCWCERACGAKICSLVEEVCKHLCVLSIVQFVEFKIAFLCALRWHSIKALR